MARQMTKEVVIVGPRVVIAGKSFGDVETKLSMSGVSRLKASTVKSLLALSMKSQRDFVEECLTILNEASVPTEYEEDEDIDTEESDVPEVGMAE